MGEEVVRPGAWPRDVEGYLGEEFQQDLLPLGEGALHLATDKEGIDDISQKTEGDHILDGVAHQRPGYSCTRFRAELVTVMPALEGTLVLHIGEVIIPFEFGDARDPPRADRQKRNDAKRRNDRRAHARCLVNGYARRPFGRRDSLQDDQSCVAGCRHDPGQVLRVGEKLKHALQGEGDPLFEVKLMRRWLTPMASSSHPELRASCGPKDLCSPRAA